eukprot:6995786-Prymnesium_polylepis.1
MAEAVINSAVVPAAPSSTAALWLAYLGFGKSSKSSSINAGMATRLAVRRASEGRSASSTKAFSSSISSPTSSAAAPAAPAWTALVALKSLIEARAQGARRLSAHKRTKPWAERHRSRMKSRPKRRFSSA